VPYLESRLVPRPSYLAIRAYTRARIVRGRLLRRGVGWTGVRILGYHRLADERHVLCVRPERFRAQMQMVLESGCELVRLDAALELLAGAVEGRYVCVTFDDGYRDNLEQGAPVLEELDIPATIFVPTRILDGEADYWWFRDPPPALTWDELRALVAGGLVDAQAHTRTHPLLPRVTAERARDEIAGSRDDLEERLGYAPTSFCYPAGLYGDREVELVRQAGYRAAVTTRPGVNAGGAPMETLHRTLVYWQDSDADFRAKLDGVLDRPPALRDWLYRRRAAA
jgi:peptidoglycan/xylan/chitin deacetylase (PgdA/CDA1 family)